MTNVRGFTIRMMVIAIVTLIARGQAQPQKFAFGEGIAASCGVWQQARQASSLKRGLMAQWVVGFLSGVNLESPSTDFLLGNDFDGLMAWVDNYCQSHPLDKVATAASNLVIELRSRASGR